MEATSAPTIDFEAAAELFKVGACATRLRILAAVVARPRDVREIEFAASVPCNRLTSAHLSKMRAWGLVRRQRDGNRDGRRMIYTATERGRKVIALAESMKEGA